MTVTLSRAAESAYWIGRYVERASSLVRAARSIESLCAEISGIDPELPPGIWQDIARIFSLGSWDCERPDERIERLLFHRSDPMSAVASLHSARENARAFMGAAGTEVFTLLNETWHLVEDWSEHPPRGLVAMRSAMEEIERRIFMVCGAMEHTAGRGDPWRFLQAGTMLERAFRTTCVLEVMLPGLVGKSDEQAPVLYARMRSLLRMVAALDAYRRVAGARLDAERIASFLVLAPQAPRGVLPCLTEVERCLESVERHGHSTDPIRRVGMLVARLRFEAAESPGESLRPDGLASLADEIGRLNASITDRFFRV
ncbi:MAG: alpha-E domain-containing protein [Phycisphaerales bacterium]|nr:alpha-E domain-containing protein [Phycisphaerales bacterium]